MKTWRLTLACLAAIGVLADSGWSRPVDLSAPSGGLGAANSKGYLEIWCEIEDAGIDFGPGSYLPLRYKFSSDDSKGGILGPGFYLPMLEAKNVLIRESTMRAYLPCGKGLYLWKDTVDPTKFHTPDEEWTGALSANNDFTVWRDDGWTIFYHQGRLTSITTDEHHVFTWDYDGNTHMATSISKDGQSLVTVEPNQQGLVDAIVIDGKRYELSYNERPLMEILQGQPVIKQLALALSNFKYPDGKSETSEFALTPERVPTFTLTAPDQKQTVYTWDISTSHIATEQGPDGNWTYKIGEITQDFGQPPITRTRPDGKSEGITVDNTMGTYTSTGADGVTTVTHVFETPGPLYHKVKSIAKTTNNVSTTIYKASYDETGRLIRQMDERGWVTTFKYDATGKQIAQKVSFSTDPAVLASLAVREKTLLEKLKKSNNKYYLVQDLYEFYISELAYDKAENLAPLMTDRKQLYNLKLDSTVTNPNLSTQERDRRLALLVQEFPDEKEYTKDFMSKKETQ